MTAAIFAKTWTVRASAAKAAQRAGLAKGSYIIAECNGEFAILELETEQDRQQAEMDARDAAAAAAAEAHANAEEEANDAIAAITAPRPENATALPTPPDFSKPSHAPYRKRLAAMVEAAEKGDAAFLAGLTFKVERSSQKIMARYRDACLTALKA